MEIIDHLLVVVAFESIRKDVVFTIRIAGEIKEIAERRGIIGCIKVSTIIRKYSVGRPDIGAKKEIVAAIRVQLSASGITQIRPMRVS